MSGKLKHRFVSPVADEGVSTEVGPNEWNDSLVVSEGVEGQVPVRRAAQPDGWQWESIGASPANVQMADVNNSGTGETDLHVYTIPANHFNVNGRGVRLRAWGVFAANANVKTVRIRFGSGTAIVVNPVTAAPNGSRWSLTYEVFRTGANAQEGFFESLVALLQETHGRQTETQTDTGAIALKVTGQSAVGSNDITIQGSMLEFLG